MAHHNRRKRTPPLRHTLERIAREGDVPLSPIQTTLDQHLPGTYAIADIVSRQDKYFSLAPKSYIEQDEIDVSDTLVLTYEMILAGTSERGRTLKDLSAIALRSIDDFESRFARRVLGGSETKVPFYTMDSMRIMLERGTASGAYAVCGFVFSEEEPDARPEVAVMFTPRAHAETLDFDLMPDSTEFQRASSIGEVSMLATTDLTQSVIRTTFPDL